MKILILGGYGVFGGRLASLISDLDITVLIAGRSLNKAKAFCDTLAGLATFQPITLDRAQIVDALALHSPDLVVDASGPFQHYTGDPYGVISACIDAHVNYLNLADGADFVSGISQLNDQAKQAGVFALSGVSSFPVLTAAVLREMEKQAKIDTVWGGIAPSPYAGIGLNVMRAVVGYAGAPVTLTRNGAKTQTYGLTEVRNATIAPPGHVPLRHLRFSLVDVPDLQVIPPEHPDLQEIWMGAGPVPDFLHRMLNLLAKLRSKGLLPALLPAAPLFYRILNLMKFGEHRGGMIIKATGSQDGQPITLSWHLLAEGDDGPFIPSMAIEALIRKMLNGQAPRTGARPATKALELADYDALFAKRTIYTGWRTATRTGSVYAQLLGDVYASLPEQVQRIHVETETRQWQGQATVTPGNNPISRFFARILGFPTKGGSLPVTVTFEPDETGEVWTRNFDGQILQSHQSIGTGRDAYLLVESFGPLKVALALELRGDEMHLVARHWRIFGIPLPKFLLPSGVTYESEKDGKFCFHVDINAPLIGRIVRYQGNLTRID